VKFEYMLGDKSLTVVINGQPYHVTRPTNEEQQRKWDAVKKAANDPETTVEEMLALVSTVHAVDAGIKNVPEVQLRDGRLYYNGDPVHGALADRIVDIIQEGFPVEPWVKFAQNVFKNPSTISIDELYLFLEKSDLPITEDGHIFAWKNVREDYMDIYSGTFYNGVGAICEMPREEVDPNRDQTCSRGLHFAAKDYLRCYSPGRKTVVVKINPADIVSIPSDYDNAKGRCWRYEVVDEIPYEEVEAYRWDPVVRSDWSFENDDWDELQAYCDYCDEKLTTGQEIADGICEDCRQKECLAINTEDAGQPVPQPEIPRIPTTPEPETKGFKSWVLRKLGE
jgi:hypothetical protein